jgi:hypothetical protein
MQVQRNASISGSRICPCSARRNPLLWGRFGIVEDNGFKVAVESTTTIQKTNRSRLVFFARNPQFRYLHFLPSKSDLILCHPWQTKFRGMLNPDVTNA